MFIFQPTQTAEFSKIIFVGHLDSEAIGALPSFLFVLRV